ncbi:hypothetical protein [Pseudoruegeria sp. HB172150]|uniref:hypothetical protein n=1 Tax=Pseudoruegeria sp. HB172150 TaxID=2721164 RepID=UPI0015579574|nr:hypothetical protein [Pseudoruegeria sp. HB172150]
MAKPRRRTYRNSGPSKSSAAEIIAAVVSVLWIVLVGLYYLFSEPDGRQPLERMNFVFMLLVLFLPVAMMWIGAAAARSSRIMREESTRLQAAIDAIRESYVLTQTPPAGAMQPTVEQKLEEIARTARKAETALTTFTSIRHSPQVRPPDANALPTRPVGTADDQGSLALGTPSEALAEPVSVADFLRALNFPENADDKEGFRALRLALHDRQTAQLITAAQGVLTSLAEEGIYMDDLTPDRARPEIWRRFAAGERGRTIAALGGVRDRSSLALSAGRMRQDPEFRDAVHHFLRRFDAMLVAFEPTATDAELAELSDTRTARAFMLLGRVAGVFA